MRRSKSRRAAGATGRAALLAALGALGALACAAPRGGAEDPEEANDVPDPADSPTAAGATILMADDLRLTLSLPGGPPAANEPFDVALEVRNEGEAEVVLDFADAQRYDFEIASADGTVVWRWAADLMFAQMIGRETLPPGETVRWSERVEPGLPAGRYRVVATLTARDRPTVETTVTIEGT